MTPEELLRKRYLVIADYPDSAVSIGDILSKQENDYWVSNTKRYFNLFNPANYPAIFRPLEWWEYRDEKDLQKEETLK